MFYLLEVEMVNLEFGKYKRNGEKNRLKILKEI